VHGRQTLSHSARERGPGMSVRMEIAGITLRGHRDQSIAQGLDVDNYIFLVDKLSPRTRRCLLFPSNRHSGPRSRALMRQVLARATSISHAVPCSQSRRRRALTDVDGNVFLDFRRRIGVMNIGHSDPQVVDA